MKIVFAIPAMGFGGAERVVSVLSNEFVQKGHEVSIALLSGNDNCAYTLDKRVELTPICTDGGILKTWSRFRKTCKDKKADVVIAFMTSVGIMSSLFLAATGIPVITSERCDPYAKDMALNFKFKVLSLVSPLFTAGYVFQSEGAKGYYSKYIQKKSCVILNPLNTDQLPQREEGKIDERIVSVGRLHSQKNHKMLIQAFANSKAKEKHTLHIYGDGELKKELHDLIVSLNMSDKIILEGNSRQVHEDIKNAKLFAFTSDYEGLPNALMEAMAIGVPCVSTDCSPGGARMLIENNENGILIPCGDTAALTAVFDELPEDEEKLKKFSANGQKLRESVCVEMIANRWLKCIEQII